LNGGVGLLPGVGLLELAAEFLELADGRGG
jgi:hypothetical protein